MATNKSTAPTAAQSVRSEAERPLPDRLTLQERVVRQTLKLCQAQSLITCIRARLEESGDAEDRACDARDALPALLHLLGEVSGYLDDELLAPAEAQEVAS